MKRLTKEQVMRMHTLLIEKSGGSDGIRDEKLLESALSAPFQSFDGEDLYKSIRAKATKLGFFLIKNHPFIDGNKRTGIFVMLIFLEINGIDVSYTDEDIIRIGWGLAEGSVSDKELLSWIIENS